MIITPRERRGNEGGRNRARPEVIEKKQNKQKHTNQPKTSTKYHHQKPRLILLIVRHCLSFSISFTCYFLIYFFLLSCMGFYAKKYVKEKEKSNQPQNTSHHRTCPPTPFSTFFNQLFSSHFFLVLLRCVQFCVPYTFPSTTLALSLIVSPLFFVVRFRYARRLSALRHGNQFFSASFV